MTLSSLRMRSSNRSGATPSQLTVGPRAGRGSVDEELLRDQNGLRSRRPGPAILDPLMQEIEGALAEDLSLKDADGNVPAPDRFMVELAAIALLRVRLPLRL